VNGWAGAEWSHREWINVSERVPAWLADRTFSAVDWSLDALLELKGDRRISVVVPARNEAATIGPIVAAIRTDLMVSAALVNELIVIDSDSTDDTGMQARNAGAVVHTVAQIRPELGWFPGKGEAMWKSLFVATGDIIIFIDGDLTSFSSEYVQRLAWPLLQYESIQLVKGFYHRDLATMVDGLAQGGRVTELTARPLLNLWWPELAGVIQPLAGEWAARRDHLMTLRVPCGYGVEFAVLVDTFERWGLDALAQVDLGKRTHVHQDLASLGAMAAEIIAAASLRHFNESAPVDAEIVHPDPASPDAWERWATMPINAVERPPVVGLP